MIANYADLVTAIGAWMHRTDLASDIPTFIQLAESRIKRDERIRNQIGTTLIVATEEVALPTDFVANDALAHNGPRHFFDLDVVGMSQLGDFQKHGALTGAPRAVAFIDQQRARFVPAPDRSYDLLFSYWQTIRSLDGVSVLTNWLLDSSPDVYLYACLIEASSFLRDPENEQKYEQKYEEKVERLHRNANRGQYGGPMRRIPAEQIGGYGRNAWTKGGR